MKIFMLIKKLRYSGAYKMFMWLAKSLADKGFEVVVMTYMRNDVEKLPENVKWIKEDLEGKGFWKQTSFVRTQIKRLRPDCSISFLLDANLINTLACLGTKTKSIICERNDPYKPHYYKLHLTKGLFRFADGAVCQLPKVKDFYSMVKGPVAVIPNPVILPSQKVELKRFEERENIIVSLGRLDVFQKRQDVLILAFAMFRSSHPGYKLKLYGDGPDEEKLKKLAREAGVSKYVKFCGVTNNSYEVLREAKFFVLSSDFEGIPNALVEAMSIGLPCISTKCSPGGAEYLIQHGVNGLLVKTNNAKDLMHAMSKIVDTNIADELGNHAKSVLYTFSEERIITMWSDYVWKLYRQ